MKRKGLGKGLGKGYKNIVTRDPFIHGLSAKGVKTRKPRVVIGKKKILFSLNKEEIGTVGGALGHSIAMDKALIFPNEPKEKTKQRMKFTKEKEELFNRLRREAKIELRAKGKESKDYVRKQGQTVVSKIIAIKEPLIKSVVLEDYDDVSGQVIVKFSPTIMKYPDYKNKIEKIKNKINNKIKGFVMGNILIFYDEKNIIDKMVIVYA